MKVKFAHLRERARSGGHINCAVFDAKSTSSCSSANNALLSGLTTRARSQGLKIDQSALVYRNGSRTQFFGDQPLVDLLSKAGIPKWTHTIDA